MAIKPDRLARSLPTRKRHTVGERLVDSILQFSWGIGLGALGVEPDAANHQENQENSGHDREKPVLRRGQRRPAPQDWKIRSPTHGRRSPFPAGRRFRSHLPHRALPLVLASCHHAGEKDGGHDRHPQRLLARGSKPARQVHPEGRCRGRLTSHRASGSLPRWIFAVHVGAMSSMGNITLHRSQTFATDRPAAGSTSRSLRP